MSVPAIAHQLGMPVSTVGGILRRLGLGKLAALEPRPPAVRYGWPRWGELLHIDIRKPGRIEALGRRITGDRRDRKRGGGREYGHVGVDDASRLAYGEVLPDEQGRRGAARRTPVGWFASPKASRSSGVITDHGSACRSRCATSLQRACEPVNLKQEGAMRDHLNDVRSNDS